MLMHYFQFRLSYKPEIELVPIYLACSDLPLKFRFAPADGKYIRYDNLNQTNITVYT